jgi:hypothetical protein
MTVKELIHELQKCEPAARVFMGYDGNIVVSESDEVIVVTQEEYDSHTRLHPSHCLFLSHPRQRARFMVFSKTRRCCDSGTVGGEVTDGNA